MELKPLSRDETIAFFSTLQELSFELPDTEKTVLAATELSFIPGYRLITARLQPQTTCHQNRMGTILSEKHRSCFLYNPAAKRPIRRIIPLSPDEDWNVHINWYLGVRIDENRAVDYLKFYAHVRTDDVFLPVDAVQNIDWSTDASDSTKAEVCGAINADLPPTVRRNDNHIPIIFEDIFEFIIPALHEGRVCRTKAKVSERGYVEYRMERIIYRKYSNPVYKLHEAAPYYFFDFKNPIYATPALRVAGLAQTTFEIVGIAALLLTFVAVINVASSWFTERLDYLGMRSIVPLAYWDGIYDVVLFGTVIYFVIEVVVSVRDGFRWRAAGRGPGKLAAAWKSMQVEVKNWRWFHRSIWWGLLQYFIVGLIMLLCSWSFIVFWSQYEYSLFFESDVSPTLRESFQYALAQFLDTYLFWTGPPERHYEAPFDQTSTFYGRFLPVLIPGSVGVVLFRTVARLFRLLRRGTRESP